MVTLHELAAHVKEMRNLQTAYFASKKENRWGDKKLLAASKAKEAEVDGLVMQVLADSLLKTDFALLYSGEIDWSKVSWSDDEQKGGVQG